MAGATVAGGSASRRGARDRVARVFRFGPQGANWARAVAFLDVGLVPLVVFWAIGHEEYLLSALFGLLFASLADMGGGYGRRAAHVSAFALLGAAVTALAFGIGAQAWGWLVLASFAVTLAAGLAVVFGARRFVNAVLLNVWFVVALGLAFSLHHHSRVTSHTWAQVLAWAGGAALWLALTFAGWLIRGREDRPPPFADIPGDTSRRELSPPLAAFALVRALVIAGTSALAYGLDLSDGYWIPIAAVVAMKPSLEQAALVSAQRLAGAVIGACAAMLLLLLPAGLHGLEQFAMKRGLEVVALVLLMHGVAVRFVNYALYSAAVAAGVLVLIDLPQPSHYSAEADRVLWTLCGTGVALLVMLPSSLAAGRRGGAPADGR